MPALQLSKEQANQYLRTRQRLAPRVTWDAKNMAALPLGIYATAPMLHLTILARADGFQVTDLDQALYAERSLVRMQAMRRSAFAVPTALVPIVFNAHRPKHIHDIDRFLANAHVTPAAYQGAAKRILKLLAAGPHTSAQLKKALKPLDSHVDHAFAQVLSRLAADALIVRGRARGSWRSLVYEYHLYENWLPDMDLGGIDEAAAQLALARLYFGSYGPATYDDFRWWTHLGPDKVERALEALAPELQPLSIEGLPGEYFLLTKDADQLVGTQVARAHAVDLLPVWDAYLMGYTHRERYLPPKFQECVVDRSGNVAPTIFVDGAVAGIWDTEEDRHRIVFKAAFFKKQPKAVWRNLAAAAERLYRAIHPEADLDFQLRDCSPPPTLVGASNNRFQFPLRDVAGRALES